MPGLAGGMALLSLILALFQGGQTFLSVAPDSFPGPTSAL